MVDDAHERLAAMVQSEDRAPRGHAVHELLGPVDGIEDPLPGAVGAGRRIFLAEDAVLGEPAGDHLAQAALDRLIDVGDDGGVGLDLDVEAALESRLDDPPRFVGHLERRGVVALDVAGRNAHGRASAMIRQNWAVILAPREVWHSPLPPPPMPAPPASSLNRQSIVVPRSPRSVATALFRIAG